jgi:hypothetical protein
LAGKSLYFRENPAGNRGAAEQKHFFGAGRSMVWGLVTYLFLLSGQGEKSRKEKMIGYIVQGSKFKVMGA